MIILPVIGKANQTFRKAMENYPHKHLIGKWYIVRNKPRGKFSLVWWLVHESQFKQK